MQLVLIWRRNLNTKPNNFFSFFQRSYMRCNGAKAVHPDRGVRRMRAQPWCAQYRGQTSCRHRIVSSSFRFLWLAVHSLLLRPQSSVQHHVRPLFFPVSLPPFCSSFFQASRQVAVAFGFRHYWGVCLHLLLWSLLSHFFLHPVP